MSITSPTITWEASNHLKNIWGKCLFICSGGQQIFSSATVGSMSMDLTRIENILKKEF